MINQKYLELINKDIDNALSIEEKELLQEYLKSNPEASNMHQDLTEVEALLDKLPDPEPSNNLKLRILNSIDFDRYAHKKKHSIKEYFFTSFSGTRRKLTLSFALGLAAGIILLSIVFYAAFNNTSESNNVLGTIGLSDSHVIEAVNVNSSDIKGKIDVIKAANQYALYVNLNSPANYTLEVRFDNGNLRIDNPAGRFNLPYSLMLSPKESSTHKILLTISRRDNKIFEKLLKLEE